MLEEIMKLKDISNQKFGKLTAIEIAYRKGHFTYWHCKCECGKEKDVLISNLTCGKTVSCGCSYKDMGQRLRKFNEYKINNNIVTMKTFNTNRNFYFDLDDLDKVKDLCWFETSLGYIANKSSKKIKLLHRIVTNCPTDKVVDHIDHNTLNNCKKNLRVCTQKENMMNRKMNNNNELKCYGISKIQRNDNFYYIVQLGGYKGCYKNFEDALKVRNDVLEERQRNFGRNYL